MLSRGVVHDPVLEGAVVTIPEVRCSPDLRNATVFVMPLGGQDTAGVIAALKRNQKYIRGAIARAINLKYAPQLTFAADDTFDEAQKVSAILSRPDVRRDLDRDRTQDQDD